MSLEQEVGKRILRLRNVESATGLSRSSICRRVKDKTFPPFINLGANGRCIGWLESEVQQWIDSDLGISFWVT